MAAEISWVQISITALGGVLMPTAAGLFSALVTIRSHGDRIAQLERDTREALERGQSATTATAVLTQRLDDLGSQVAEVKVLSREILAVITKRGT